MGQYSIKDLENLTGVKAHTLRIWEQRFALVQPHRSSTNRRSYTDEGVKKLMNIASLNRRGAKISELAKMCEHELNASALEATDTEEQADKDMEFMLRAMISMDEKKFNKVFDQAVANHGFQNVFIRSIIPLLIKTGSLWRAGVIHPGQEHFVSNLIRQKLISAIEGIKKRSVGTSSRFLLFLPEGEWHELGLLFISYLIQKNGHPALYMGQNTPPESVDLAIKSWSPQYVVLSASSSLTIHSAQGMIKDIRSRHTQVKWITKGIFDWKEEQLVKDHNVWAFDDFQDFITFLGSVNSEDGKTSRQ